MQVLQLGGVMRLREFLFLLAALLPGIGRAQSAYCDVTVVQGTLNNSDGSAFTGTLSISWPGFVGRVGSLVPSGSTSVAVFGGAVKIPLCASDSASYTVLYNDITGSLVYDTRTAEFSFQAGPVFTNLLLADEINRTPPKTQSSLLEAMEERQVTVDGTPRPLPDPFLVAATQNPVEYEGTYPLPEAQLDRFLLKLTIPLPSRQDEIDVLTRHAEGFNPRDLKAAGVRPVASAADLEAARAAVARTTVSPEITAYVVDICRATRESPSLTLGVSPRGATALLSTARAWAWLTGRDYVIPDDVKALALPTLRHRIQLRPEAEMEGVTADSVINAILTHVPVPR